MKDENETFVCSGCGNPFPLQRVRQPVYRHGEKVAGEFEWVDQPGDCPRCQGAY